MNDEQAKTIALALHDMAKAMRVITDTLCSPTITAEPKREPVAWQVVYACGEKNCATMYQNEALAARVAIDVNGTVQPLFTA